MKNINNRPQQAKEQGPEIKKIVPRITGGRIQAILDVKQDMSPGIPYARYKTIMSSVEWQRMIQAYPEYFIEYKGHNYIKPEYKKNILPALELLIKNPKLHAISIRQYCAAR